MTALEKLIRSSKSHIVLGTQYGDEGKGSITSKLAYLLSKKGTRFYSDNGINNYRFGGGMQVGHTTFDGENYIEHHAFPAAVHVVLSDIKLNSRFINYNSDPYINLFFEKNCVISFEKLYEDLLVYRAKYDFVAIRLNIHEKCVVSTFLDVYENRISNTLNNHGSTGLGFGKTIERCENCPELRFTVEDFLDIIDISGINVRKETFEKILLEIAKYYRILVDDDFYNLLEESYNIFQSIISDPAIELSLFNDYVNDYNGYNIYEGHQGALLDKDSEDFPHVTRSKTTCRLLFDTISTNFSNINLSSNVKKGIKDFCVDNNLNSSNHNIYSIHPSYNFLFHLVTRIYSTRHGNGPFVIDPIKLTNNSNESNKFNPYQLNFKTSKLNFKDLERGISYIIRDIPYNVIPYSSEQCSSDEMVSDNFYKSIKFILHVTCCDQVDIEYYYDTISKISEMPIIKDNNIIIKTHETNDFRVF